MPEATPGNDARKVRVSIRMPPDMVAALRVASFQRGSWNNRKGGVSQLVREAVEEWLDREIDRPISAQIVL